MSIGKEIATEAKKKKICKESFNDLNKATDVKTLCEMYFKGDDWTMKNDFPGLALLEKYKDESGEFGLHTHFKGTLKNQENTALLGKSDAQLEYDNFFVGKLIVRHTSKAKIRATGNAILYINLLDNAHVDVVADEKARVFINQYGSTSGFRITGAVDVKEKTWK